VKRRNVTKREADDLIDEASASLLEVVDHVITKGVVLSGEVMIGLAGIDLIYLKLSAVLGAADRILGTSGRKADKP